MANPRSSKIEPIHIEEAAALKALYNARSGQLKLSQAEFGAQFGLGSQGMVWQYLNAGSPLNLAAAVKFAKGLGCEVSDFSARLAKEQGDLLGLLTPRPSAVEEPPSTPGVTQPAALGSDDWTVEQLMAALAEKLLKEAHPADVEAAPSDLKRIIEKARDPDARIQMSTTRQLLPDRRRANSGRQR